METKQFRLEEREVSMRVSSKKAFSHRNMLVKLAVTSCTKAPVKYCINLSV